MNQKSLFIRENLTWKIPVKALEKARKTIFFDTRKRAREIAPKIMLKTRFALVITVRYSLCDNRVPLCLEKRKNLPITKPK